MGSRYRPLLYLILWTSSVTIGWSQARNDAAADTAVTDAHQPSAHRTAICRACHWTQVSPDSSDASAAGYREQCLSCHQVPAAASGTLSDLFHSRPDHDCSDCHSYHRTNRLTIGGQTLEAEFDDRLRFLCRTCHTAGDSVANLSEGHLEAAEYYHANGSELSDRPPSESCLDCHSKRGILDSDRKTPHKAIQINEMASHPVGMQVFQSGDRSLKIPTDSRIRLFDGSIECQSCHSLTSGADDTLVKFSSPYDLCLSCHTQGDRSGSGSPLVSR